MNKISFKVIKTHKYDSGHEDSTINIVVDDQPLAIIMFAYETPFAIKEGHPGLAGDYHAIEVATSSLEQYYLGNKGADCGADKNKTMVLGCSCGVSACWPLLCKITVDGDRVIWSDFEQPHRDEEWDYSNFEGFEFDKQQYLDEIEAMKNT